MTHNNKRGRLHTGKVEKVFRHYRGRPPFGFIYGDDGMEVYFRDESGRYEVGNEVVYRARQGNPSPVATWMRLRSEYEDILARSGGGHHHIPL